MDEMVIKGLYVALLKVMLHNIEQASTERAHNHIKLLYAFSELTGLRSQRVEILPKWQTLALACWKALSGPVAVVQNDYTHFANLTDGEWRQTKEVLRDFLGMFTAGNIH